MNMCIEVNDLTKMDDGEHWFHTDEQIKFLDDWIINSIR